MNSLLADGYDQAWIAVAVFLISLIIAIYFDTRK